MVVGKIDTDFFVENPMSKIFFVEKIISADECNELVFKFLHQIFRRKLFYRKLTFVEKNSMKKILDEKIFDMGFSTKKIGVL